MTDPLPDLTTFLNNLATWLISLASIVFILSIIIAGFLRMPLFGVSERRTALSNAALLAAVIAMIIILSAFAIDGAMKQAFPQFN